MKLKLVEEWRQFYKMSSVWILAFMAAVPAIYNEMASMGLLDKVPEDFATMIRCLAAIGVICRLTKQESIKKE